MKTWDIQDEADEVAARLLEELESQTSRTSIQQISGEGTIYVEGALPERGIGVWSSGWAPSLPTRRIPINLAESVEELAKRIAAATTMRIVGPESLRGLLTETTKLRRDLAKLREETEELREQVASFFDIVESRPIVTQTWLRDLGSDTYRLRSPVLVTVEEYTDEVVARWPEVEAFGAGDTETQALAALREDIVSLFEDMEHLLRAEPDRLGKPLRSVFRVLADVVEKVNG